MCREGSPTWKAIIEANKISGDGFRLWLACGEVSFWYGDKGPFVTLFHMYISQILSCRFVMFGKREDGV